MQKLTLQRLLTSFRPLNLMVYYILLCCLSYRHRRIMVKFDMILMWLVQSAKTQPSNLREWREQLSYGRPGYLTTVQR